MPADKGQAMTTPEQPETQQETNAGVARATGVLALGNITSRVLGLARDLVLTNVYGASYAVDAFYVAILIPKSLYDLLIAGHVNSAIIPVLSEVDTRDGRTALWRLVSVLMSLVTVCLALLVIVLEVFAPQAVQIVGSGYSEATLTLAAGLLRITAPALIFLGLFSVLSGALYALRDFTLAAFAGAGFNLGIVLVTLFFAPPLQIASSFPHDVLNWVVRRPAEGIAAAATGWLVGSLVQIIILSPGLRKHARLRLTLSWRHPALRQIVILYAPVMFSLIMDTLVIRLVSYNIASNSIEGSLGYMNWATTLIQFPQGLVATAISIAILPTLSRQAALVLQNGYTAFRDTLGLGLRLTMTLILPATVGLFVLAGPIIVLLFQHGAFTAADTDITALALRYYLIGLPFAAVDLLLVYAFYAQQDTLTPALIGLLSLTLYLVAAVMLFPTFGLYSLMLADSLKHIVHAVISTALLARRIQGFGNQRLILTFAKAGLAAVVMGLVADALVPMVSVWTATQGFLGEALLVLICGGVSVMVFAGMAFVLRIEELRWLISLIRSRLGLG